MIKYKRSNIIFYCQRWQESTHFYQHIMGFDVEFSNDWFVEFKIFDGSFISIANENNASIKSAIYKETTLSIEVVDIYNAHDDLVSNGAKPTAIKNHSWGGMFIFIYDPEGRRIELWQKD